MKDTIIRSLEDAFAGIDKKAAKITVLGVGSELRADDGAGLLIAENLIKKCGQDKCDLNSKLQVIYGATAPENFTGDIRRFAPTHLILLDSAHMGLEPGDVKIIKKEDISGITFSTHVLPLSVIINYLTNSFKL
ncbi:MAG: hydrogenase maturation protease, partial [Proteobacteria bacterium]|nr:hydrogenase maturation protease [Pseudomonadota bacterium]